MTVPAGTPIRRYDGNDVATNFPFTEIFFANTDLIVTHRSGGSDNILVLDTDYTVNGAGTATGSIDFPKIGSTYSTLATGEVLSIRRLIPQQRVADLVADYFFGPMNLDMDKFVVMLQDIYFLASRAAIYTDPNSDAAISLEDLLVATGYGFNVQTLNFSIKGNTVITTGVKDAVLEAPQSGIITRASMISTLNGVKYAGDLDLEIYKNDVKITASEPLELDGGSEATNITLTGWNKAFLTNDKFTIKPVGTVTVYNVDIFLRYIVTGA